MDDDVWVVWSAQGVPNYTAVAAYRATELGRTLPDGWYVSHEPLAEAIAYWQACQDEGRNHY